MPPKTRSTSTSKATTKAKPKGAKGAKGRTARAKPAAARIARSSPTFGSDVIGQLNLATLHVRDYDTALRFYRDSLGLPEGHHMAPVWLEFRIGRDLVLGVHADPGRTEEGAREPGGPSGLYFTVPDLDRAVATLQERGVKIADEPSEKPYGRDAAFLDPDGNLLCLVEPKGA